MLSKWSETAVYVKMQTYPGQKPSLIIGQYIKPDEKCKLSTHLSNFIRQQIDHQLFSAITVAGDLNTEPE